MPDLCRVVVKERKGTPPLDRSTDFPTITPRRSGLTPVPRSILDPVPSQVGTYLYERQREGTRRK